jgi:hypothetical protein
MSSSHGKSSHDQPAAGAKLAGPFSNAAGAPTLETGVGVHNGCVGVGEGVGVKVAVGVRVSVGVAVNVGVSVAVGVGVGVWVGVGL